RGNPASVEYKAGRTAAMTHDAPDLAPRPFLVPLDDADETSIRIMKRTRPWALGRFGKRDGLAERAGIELPRLRLSPLECITRRRVRRHIWHGGAAPVRFRPTL